MIIPILNAKITQVIYHIVPEQHDYAPHTLRTAQLP